MRRSVGGDHDLRSDPQVALIVLGAHSGHHVALEEQILSFGAHSQLEAVETARFGGE